MTSVSAGHIILTPTEPVGSGRPQREFEPGASSPGVVRSTAELPPPPPPTHTHTVQTIIISFHSFFLSCRIEMALGESELLFTYKFPLFFRYPVWVSKQNHYTINYRVTQFIQYCKTYSERTLKTTLQSTQSPFIHSYICVNRYSLSVVWKIEKK